MPVPPPIPKLPRPSPAPITPALASGPTLAREQPSNTINTVIAYRPFMLATGNTDR
jgi:hypothetical protein